MTINTQVNLNNIHFPSIILMVNAKLKSIYPDITKSWDEFAVIYQNNRRLSLAHSYQDFLEYLDKIIGNTLFDIVSSNNPYQIVINPVCATSDVCDLMMVYTYSLENNYSEYLQDLRDNDSEDIIFNLNDRLFIQLGAEIYMEDNNEFQVTY